MAIKALLIMKAIVLALTLLVGIVQAQTVPQCAAEHFKLVRQYPDIKYEQDKEIVNIWCNCKTQQVKQGVSVEKSVEYCTHNTNKEINIYLKNKGII